MCLTIVGCLRAGGAVRAAQAPHGSLPVAAQTLSEVPSAPNTGRRSVAYYTPRDAFTPRDTSQKARPSLSPPSSAAARPTMMTFLS